MITASIVSEYEKNHIQNHWLRTEGEKISRKKTKRQNDNIKQQYVMKFCMNENMQVIETISCLRKYDEKCALTQIQSDLSLNKVKQREAASVCDYRKTWIVS
jgi:hypothetical protein